MREKITRPQIAVALVGVGPTWDQHYRDAVCQMSSKLCVRAVCDAVHARAAAVAEEFRAEMILSPWQLAQRSDLKAWLIIDPGWFGTYPAEVAVRFGRAALFVNSFAADLSRLARLYGQGIERGETLMAAFPQRFAPATTRMRELIATKLGPVRKIEVRVPAPSSRPADLITCLCENQAEYIGLFDWCACLIQRPIRSVHWNFGQPGCILRLDSVAQFEPAGVLGPSAEIMPFHAATEKLQECERRIVCERGSATIVNSQRIVWKTESEQADESLVNERSPFEIVIDQFCRRALGGLVPVPTLSDALRAIAVMQAVLEPLHTNRQLNLNV
jgi:predicted dehydrogenase